MTREPTVAVGRIVRPHGVRGEVGVLANLRGRVLLEGQERIVAIHAALVDPAVVSVNDLVDRVAASQRTIERLCHRHFGFSPKVLDRKSTRLNSSH